MLQMVRGCVGSVTSARTGWVVPWTVMSASWEAGWPEQVACMAPHEGTVTGPGVAGDVGVGEGFADGLDAGLGESLEDAVAVGDADGLLRDATPFVPPQAAMASTAMTAASLVPTGKTNECVGARVTRLGFEFTAHTISPAVTALNEQRFNEVKTLFGVVLLAFSACLDAPPALTADVSASATQSAIVGGRAQLVVNVTNTGPALSHLGLTFMSADKWYERHTVTDPGGCNVDADHSALDCGDLAAGASATFSITGTALAAGTFHYQLALRELVRPFRFVNDHPDGADLQTWNEIVATK